jgi:hypothetical protein
VNVVHHQPKSSSIRVAAPSQSITGHEQDVFTPVYIGTGLST